MRYRSGQFPSENDKIKIFCFKGNDQEVAHNPATKTEIGNTKLTNSLHNHDYGTPVRHANCKMLNANC